MRNIIKFLRLVGEKVRAFFDKILPKPKTVILENGTEVNPPRSVKIYISLLFITS